MIRSIFSNGHVTVTGGNPSMRYINSNGLLNGSLRYNNGNFEVYDGSSWSVLDSTYASISLSGQANEAIDWVLNKMAEERRIVELSKKYPQISEALEEFNKSRKNLDIVLTLLTNGGV
jgi:organic radical activating enzyme